MNSLKLHNILFISLLIAGCGSEKFLKKDSNFLSENKLYVNGVENRIQSINQLIIPKPNTYFFGIPLKLQLDKWASEFPKEDFKIWLNEKSKRKERLNKLLSPKQVFQLEKYFLRINKWMKDNGEKPSLVDSLLINKNISKLNQYYKNIGFFDVESSFEINELRPCLLYTSPSPRDP